MATYEADKAKSGVQPREIETGANVVRASYISEVTHAAADIIQCVKVPSGAIIDSVVYAAPISGSAPAQMMCQIGDGDDPNRFGSSTLSSVAFTGNLALGYQYSLSDAADPFYDTIDVTIDAGALTVSQGFVLIVTYHCDD